MFEQTSRHFATNNKTRNLKSIFLNRKKRILIQVHLMLPRRSKIDKKTALVWDMACRKPHSEKPWASYRIRTIAGCACVGRAGNICMSGSLNHRGGENVPGIPGACATRNFTHLVKGPLPESMRDIHVRTIKLKCVEHISESFTGCQRCGMHFHLSGEFTQSGQMRLSVS